MMEATLGAGYCSQRQAAKSAPRFAVNDARTALDMYDRALSRVREVKDNDEARRERRNCWQGQRMPCDG